MSFRLARVGTRWESSKSKDKMYEEKTIFETSKKKIKIRKIYVYAQEERQKRREFFSQRLKKKEKFDWDSMKISGVENVTLNRALGGGV